MPSLVVQFGTPTNVLISIQLTFHRAPNPDPKSNLKPQYSVNNSINRASQPVIPSHLKP
jgi:hypothetical protein